MWAVRKSGAANLKMTISKEENAETQILMPKPSLGSNNGSAMGKHIFGLPSVLVAGLCYCAASGSMVLLNKHALASFGFGSPTALLCFQCALAAILVKLCELVGFVKLQPLKPDLVAVWFPVNLIFVGMIGTSFYALKEVGVGMVTVWKNLSNVVTACGDVFIYKRTYTWQVWGCLGLMLVSAVAGASTDSRFTWLGYSWQIANCFFTSAYALYLRSVMDKVAEHTTNKQKWTSSAWCTTTTCCPSRPSWWRCGTSASSRGCSTSRPCATPTSCSCQPWAASSASASASAACGTCPRPPPPSTRWWAR
eukprot:XP_001691119.1 GDP-Mannose transporter, golgi apparatus [Chlamydomonas reinhardtii]